MTYANLMVYVDDEPDNVARIGFGCDLARAFGAAVIGVSVSEAEPPLIDAAAAGGMAGEILTLRRDQADAELAAARARFEAVAAAADVSHFWRAETGYPAAWLTRQARAADLVLIGRDGGRRPYRAPDAGDLVMGVGRPVLIAPPQAEAAPLDGVALVAWQDGREAQRATAAALPLLRRAQAVRVIEICAPGQADAAQARVKDVAGWLNRHGATAEGDVRVADERPAGDRLLACVEETAANLVVAGAWGHSRLREWVLGGVTQALISRCPAWLLLSH
ncbi:universal stress protein [Brevundimonas sp. UBA7534]|uniref:universal stress protein n=1 Tax=Brevundimonas sp. UBA7534 TaxID=1946138 RepID=UPI0025C2E307|nr:universal stress protein [Brevundimonas sp. UBA7534]